MMVEQTNTVSKGQKIFNFLNKSEEVVLLSFISVTVLLIFTQVVMRYVFNNSLSWTEELARYLFIWESWLGISIGARKMKHIKIDLVVEKLKGGMGLVVLTIADVITIAILLALTYYGVDLTADILSFQTKSPALAIPMWMIYAALPVSCGIMSVRIITDTILRFRGKERC